MTEAKKGSDFRYEEAPIDSLTPNDWNPNAMSDQEFSRLVQSIEDDGMVAPLQVVVMESGERRIIGGEHRWQACKFLGYTHVGIVIPTRSKWTDEDFQKFESVRLNVIHGAIDPGKFKTLYAELVERHGSEAMQELFGFTDEKAFRRLIDSVQKGMKAAGMPKRVTDAFKDAAPEVKTVEGLGQLLNTLFREYGDSVPLSFVFFDYGGKKHLRIDCSPKTWKLLSGIFDRARREGVEANELVQRAFEGADGFDLWTSERENRDGSESGPEE